MTVYSAESFLRAKIEQPILKATVCPITVRVSKLPTLTNGLLTISPNTENEEIVEYNNPQAGTMTIDIIKRGIKPTSILLTTDGVDYNNTTFQFLHSQNDLIRGDVNHIHVNQGIGNSTLSTNLGVGISKLSIAAVSAGDPIVVGNNDPRVGDASTTQKATVKLSVAPVSAANPIAVGDNDPRLTADTIVSANGFAGTVSGANAHTISTTVTGLLKGNGTAMSAATAGTDYYAPGSTDVAVADGGTGRSSHTAYAPIFGGTTGTGAQQSGTVGNSGEVMTSNGAGVLPTFKPGIVKNGALGTVSTSSSGAGTVNSSSTGILSSPTILHILFGGTAQISGNIEKSSDDVNFTTLHSLSSYDPGGYIPHTYSFMCAEGFSYRTKYTQSSAGTAQSSITYTV